MCIKPNLIYPHGPIDIISRLAEIYETLYNNSKLPISTYRQDICHIQIACILTISP